MKTKSKTGKPIAPQVAVADAEEHAKLREILKDGQWKSYGDLRRGFDLQPSRLEFQVQTYPSVFEAGESEDGKPTIRMRPGPHEPREDIVCRRVLIKMVRCASSGGVYLKNLYLSSRIDSKTVQRLLAGAPGIEAEAKSKSSILYKWTGEQAPEPDNSRIQDFHVITSSRQINDRKTKTAWAQPAQKPA